MNPFESLHENPAHCHITLKDVSVEGIESAAKMVKGKVTPIDLIYNEGQVFKDRMITRHQRGTSCIPLFNSVKNLMDAGYNVARYKLELDLSDIQDIPLPITSANYIEVHIKVPDTFPKVSLGSEGCKVAISSNPKNMGYYFYNARAKSVEALSEVRLLLNNLQSLANLCNLPTLEVHKEYTLFDSKPSHDSFWL